jgi:hypothetical protein
MIEGKRINYTENLRKKVLEKENRHEDPASNKNELDSENEVNSEYDCVTVASRRSDIMPNTVVPVQSSGSQSSVCDLGFPICYTDGMETDTLTP